ncbi:adenosine receptor A1-like [Patiria miniata]|uniref:Adenosine-like receptor n=1 Tax=Patiria miniata TaxID=46514 RepID=Q8I9M7_PATMI|nr:adenosine receptor A1-like [Patiria miniata]XP_038061558.1 adenosine receptor A1-like [Patiria miniata]AAN33001.1 adenosine-like receptor [Patiria miniata]
MGSDVYVTVGLAAEIPIAVAAALGNALVCWAVYYNRRLRNVTNYFIVSLAIADLLVGLLAIPFALLTNAGEPRNSFHLCLFMNSFVVTLTQSSILSLLAIALDRYFAVVSPLRYKRVATARRALIVIFFTWLLAFVIGMIPVFGWNLGKPERENYACVFTEVIDMRYMVYFNFLGSVLPPLLIMLFVYVRIFRVVRKQLAAISRTMVASNDEMNRQLAALAVKEGRAAKLLAIVIILFAVSWLPLHIINTVILCTGGVNYTILLIAIILSHSNSAMNPIVYTLSNREFRRTFYRLIFKVILRGVISIRSCEPDNRMDEFTGGYTSATHFHQVRNGVNSRDTPRGTPLPLKKFGPKESKGADHCL